MKPSKKQSSTKTTKKTVNEKNSASGIKTFFKSAPKSFVVDQNAEPVASSSNDAKAFYVNILKEKLARIHASENVAEYDRTKPADDDLIEEQDVVTLAVDQQASSGNCDSNPTTECTGCIEKAIERDEWKDKYNKEVEQRKQLKKVYLNLTHRFSDLHSKYADLLKVATTPTVGETSADAGTSSDDIFTKAEVKFLQCMDLEKKADCTFVLHCLKYSYKQDISVLAQKTLKGTLEWTKITDDGGKIFHPAKTPLTPRKVERIKGLFVERVAKCQIDAVEYSDRMKESYVNKLFAAGIKNLSKKINRCD